MHTKHIIIINAVSLLWLGRKIQMCTHVVLQQFRVRCRNLIHFMSFPLQSIVVRGASNSEKKAATEKQTMEIFPPRHQK